MSTSTRAARALERRCWQLLLSLCRRDAAESIANGGWRPDPDPAAWEGAIHLAARHTILGLALSTLDRAARVDGKSVPTFPEVLSRLPQLRRRAALLEMRRDIVSETLRRAGVEPVILKGAALVGTLYADPVERDITDIDLLVPEDRVKIAVRALAAAGYAGPSSWKELCTFRRHHFHVPMELPGSATVEIHWALSRPDALFRLSGANVRDRAVRVARPGAPTFRVPAPEHMLLHLVLQNVQEGFSRLGRLVDIDRIVGSTPSIDWSALSSEARSGNLAPALALSLQLSRRLLGTPVPVSVLDELRPGPASRLHLAMLHSLDAASPDVLRRHAARLLLDLWLAPSFLPRLRMLFAILRPAPMLPSLKPPPRASERARIFGKVVAAQALFAGAVPALLAIPSGRARLKCWSSRTPFRSIPAPRAR
jgi:hypothetical protein